MWNERYREADCYGSQPNDFLREELGRLNAGNALCLAEGQGRNAIFLAQNGFDTTAMDQSDVGMRRAAELASALGVDLATITADLAQFDLGFERWDNIVSIFAHVPSTMRRDLHRRVVSALRPGSVFLLEAYTPDQLHTSGRGGPPAGQADMFMTLNALIDDLTGLEILIGRELVRPIEEGRYHQGIGAVVQFVARKPQVLTAAR